MKNFIVSYQEDGVFQAIIVKAKSLDEAERFFKEDNPDAILYGLREKADISDELKKGMPIVPVPFKYLFRAQIERLGKSQRAVAELLHIPLRTVENWLAGINEPDEFKANAVVEKLAEAIFEAE